MIIATLKNMLDAHGVMFPRSFLPKDGEYLRNENSPLLAVFSDGSQEGMAVVMYLCFELPKHKQTADKIYHVSLVKSGSRLSTIS